MWDRTMEAAASLIALSGGNTMSGDRLLTLDASKLEILKNSIFKYFFLSISFFNFWQIKKK